MKDVKKIIFLKIESQFKIQLNKEAQGLLLKEDLGFDSIKFIFFFGELTNELSLDIFDFEDAELLSISTLGDLIDLFEKKSDIPVR